VASISVSQGGEVALPPSPGQKRKRRKRRKGASSISPIRSTTRKKERGKANHFEVTKLAGKGKSGRLGPFSKKGWKKEKKKKMGF